LAQWDPGFLNFVPRFAALMPQRILDVRAYLVNKKAALVYLARTDDGDLFSWVGYDPRTFAEPPFWGVFPEPLQVFLTQVHAGFFTGLAGLTVRATRHTHDRANGRVRRKHLHIGRSEPRHHDGPAPGDRHRWRPVSVPDIGIAAVTLMPPTERYVTSSPADRPDIRSCLVRAGSRGRNAMNFAMVSASSDQAGVAATHRYMSPTLRGLRPKWTVSGRAM
jgi:hypothetical protein